MKNLILFPAIACIFTAGWSGCSENGSAGEVDAGNGQDADAGGQTDGPGDPGAGDFDLGSCPGPAEYQGETTWTGVLRASSGDCLLTGSRQEQPLEEALADKLVVRLAPGEYPLPVDPGEYPVRLPICLITAEGAEPLSLGNAGLATVMSSGGLVSLQVEQTLTDGAGTPWLVVLGVSGETDALAVHSGQVQVDSRTIGLYPPSFPNHERWRHTVIFTGGSLTSELFGRMRTPSSGLLVHASGTLDGAPFDQGSYWRLVSNHNHHFFGADWAVLFDQPIGPACGLRIDEGNPIEHLGMFPDIQMHTIECDLSPIEVRSLEDQQATSFDLDHVPCP